MKPNDEVLNVRADQPAPNNHGQSRRSQRTLKWRLKIYSAIGIISVLLLGLVAAVLSAQTNLDLRQFAWGGIRFAPGEILQGGRTDIGVRPNVTLGSAETAQLFSELTFSYAQTADITNIEVAEFGVRGTAWRVYNNELNQSFIFMRIENPPILEEVVPTVWLEQQPGSYLKAGYGEFLEENDLLVLYVVTSVEGNTDDYSTLHLSYDLNLNALEPESVLLSMNFNEESQ